MDRFSSLVEESSTETPRSSALGEENSRGSGLEDEREETIEELLNGPKDSVTMFGHRSSKPFHIDMSSGGDPLDLLMAHQLKNDRPATARNGAASSQGCGAMRNDQLVLVDLDNSPNNEQQSVSCDSEAHHTQELAYRCRHALHTQFDKFLNGAARCELTSRPSSDIRGDLPKQLEVRDQEISDLKRRLGILESQNRSANYSLKETQADLDAAELEIWSSAKEKQEAIQAQATSCAGLDEARMELKRVKEELEVVRSDARLLRGERETLRGLAATQLTELAETLTESLLRVQREHQRKFDQRNDEQLCVVCLSERKNVVLRPCNHLTMCVGCFDQCRSACPQCRSPVQDHLIIYM